MLRIFTLCSLFLLTSSFFNLSAACRVDSTYTYTFNDSNTQKTLTGRTYKTYDGNDRLISEINKFLDESNGKWINNTQTSYTYDIDGNNTSITIQVWDISTSTWKNDRRYLNTFNTDDNPDDKTSQAWDTTVKTWTNSDKITYTYNSNKLELSALFQLWENSQWVNSSKTEHTYDASNTVKQSSIRSAWKTNMWDSVTKYVYTYAFGKEISEDIQIWQGAWKNSIRRTSEYFGNGNLKSSLVQNWNANAWVNSSFETYAYSNTGCLERIDYYLNWDQNDNSWKYHLQDIYFSEGEMGIDDLKTGSIKVYPNPAHDVITISTRHKAGIKVMDMKGAMIMETFLDEGENSFDVRSFEPGIYILISGGQAQKIVIQ